MSKSSVEVKRVSIGTMRVYSLRSPIPLLRRYRKINKAIKKAYEHDIVSKDTAAELILVNSALLLSDVVNLEVKRSLFEGISSLKTTITKKGLLIER